MSIKGFEEAFVTGRNPVMVKYSGEDRTFYANEIGFLEYQNIAIQSIREKKNPSSLLVAASIETEDGEHFTYDEVQRMKEEYAKVFIEAATQVNRLGGEEKK